MSIGLEVNRVYAFLVMMSAALALSTFRKYLPIGDSNFRQARKRGLQEPQASGTLQLLKAKGSAEYSALPRVKDNKTIGVADEDAPEEHRGQQSIFLGR